MALLAFTAAAGAQDVTQAYYVDKQLQKGTVVGYHESDAERVVPLKKEAIDRMLGVVVSGNAAPIALSNGAPEQEVFVATLGRFDVLVSDQNGPIAEGDYITISTLTGVGMKADDRQETTLGVALKAFEGTGDTEGRAAFTNSAGAEQQVSLGRVPVDVRVAPNPLYVEANTSGVPAFMSRVASVVTDEPVSALRMYIAFAVMVVVLFVAGAILYIGTRSGIQSVGRNPLAKKSIARSMIQVALVSIIVFIIGLIAVYLLLTL